MGAADKIILLLSEILPSVCPVLFGSVFSEVTNWALLFTSELREDFKYEKEA